MNKQPISKQNLKPNGLVEPLEITEIFESIQGEGPWSGCPVTFIRLAGCNLQCTWCDTEYPIKEELFVRDILNRCYRKKVVITGGEPFRQNIRFLVNRLLQDGYEVQIETNGTLFVTNLPYSRITIVCSPKTKNINRKLLPYIDWFKYVIGSEDFDSEDYLPTQSTQKKNGSKVYRTPEKDKIILMPRDDKEPSLNKENTKAALKLAIDSGYRLNLQLHKLLELP